MAKKPLFTIDKDSIVKGTADGHLYCTVTLSNGKDHPFAESRPDRKKKYVYYARAIMELACGHFIDPAKFEVHHKNEDVSDNKPSNLELRTKADHARDHSRKKKFWKKSPMNKPSRKSALHVARAWLLSQIQE